jgi:hypothetical protein
LGNISPEDYLAMAISQVDAAHALRDDLLSALFPRGVTPPSELLQTRVKLKLLSLVDGIERELTGNTDHQTRSWETLAQSGLLREKRLVHFALARIAEDQIRSNMHAMNGASAIVLGQLPTVLLAHENERLADMGRSLLNAEHLAYSGDEHLYRRLPDDQLHLLCWRIVAVLQQANAADDKELVARGQGLLAAHQIDQNPANIARKLVFFLGSDHRETLMDPRKAGLQLFVATLVQEYSLDADLVLRLFHESSPAPLLLMLKGVAVSVEQLPGFMAILRGTRSEDLTHDLIETYGALNTIEARAAISHWAHHQDVDA